MDIDFNHIERDLLDDTTDSSVKLEFKEEDDDERYTMDLLRLATCVESNTDPIEFNSTDAITDPKTGKMVCLHCLGEIDSSSINAHMVNVHNYRKILFKCHICQTVFQERKLLQVHREECRPLLKTTKKKSMGQIMKEVDKILKNPENLLDTVACPVCFVEVPKFSLREHVDIEHRKPEINLTCQICNRTFKSKLTLKEHIKLVHEAVEDSEQCELCGQKFRSLKYLANHKRNVHPSGDKIHKCTVCGKEFKSRLCVHQHMKHVHPPESATVVCPHCPNKIFKSSINLHQHLKVAHGMKKKTKI